MVTAVLNTTTDILDSAEGGEGSVAGVDGTGEWIQAGWMFCGTREGVPAQQGDWRAGPTRCGKKQ
jgi:hypothetical protein